ncbi:DUF1120 domain-containing protein [Burkholderia pyrrocinia]
MQHCLSRLTVLGLLAIASSAAFADAPSSAELKVTGLIVPGACKIALPTNVDYGNILNDRLDNDKPTVLGEQDVPLTINCDADAKVALKVVDNKSATKVSGLGTGNTILGVSAPPDTNFFGLGASNNKNIGGYAVKLTGVKVGTDQADVLESPDEKTWTKSTNDLLSSDSSKEVSWAKSGTTDPLAGKVIAGTLAVQAVIDAKSKLDTASQVKLDGSATLTVDYL